MKHPLPYLFAALLFAAHIPAYAADAAKPMTASQQRMADCNKEAGSKKGQERRDFMRECMHGGVKPGAAPATPAQPATPATPAKPAEPPKMTQQERMAHCNKEAGDRRGPERRAFMSTCLKGK